MGQQGRLRKNGIYEASHRMCFFCTEAGGHFLAPCSGAETSVALGIMSHLFLLAE